MKTVRRSYIYITTFVSLMAITWALIFLIQNLTSEINRTDLAWQLAVLVIATPLFVGHWLWAERIYKREADEQDSFIRRLFLWASLAAFLAPFLAAVFGLLRSTLGLAINAPFGNRDALLDSSIVLVVLALFWLYFRRILQRDRAVKPDTEEQIFVRQLYAWGFSLTGLIMISIACVELVGRLLRQFEGTAVPSGESLLPEIVRLIVGTATWLIFWRWLQRDFAQDTDKERDSILRKIFLYATLFVGLLLAVTNLALLWDGLLLSWLGETVPGSLSDTLPLVLIGGLLAAYHWQVLQRDAHIAPFEAQQRLIRHIYEYLTATVGLLATLAGVSGLISLLILTLYGDRLDRSALAGFIATLTAGLPVWLWPWWRIQQRVSGGRSREVAQAESGSIVRRIYLYFFLLIATLTILGSGVYIVFRLFSLLFQLDPVGESSSDLALAIAYALIALVIWLYHGQLVRLDGKRQDAQRAEKLADVSVVLYAGSEAPFTDPLLAAIRQKIPNVGLAVYPPVDEAADGDLLRSADILVASSASSQAPELLASPAEKVLIPQSDAGWHWAGVDHPGREALLGDAATLVEKLALQEGGLSRRRWGLGTTIAVGAGALLLLCVLGNLLGALLGNVF